MSLSFPGSIVAFPSSQDSFSGCRRKPSIRALHFEPRLKRTIEFAFLNKKIYSVVCKTRHPISSCIGGGTGSGNNGFYSSGGNDGEDDGQEDNRHAFWKFCCGGAIICVSVACIFYSKQSVGLHSAKTRIVETDSSKFDVMWEIRRGQRRNILLDYENDEFVSVDDVDVLGIHQSAGPKKSTLRPSFNNGDIFKMTLQKPLAWCKSFIFQLMLPDGYPESVTNDYLEYSIWRMCQSIASQMNGVLSTQALLYAVGLGKGAIPTAAAVNWVLKDGIGYLSKITLSKYGRNFDVHPKGWRLFADALENTAYGLELLTSIFPQFFVYLGSAAGAGRSAAALIQAATRSCFYAGFAAQHNFAEVIAKGEAQGMVSKSLGILFGIGLSNYAGSSGSLLLGSFALVTGIHMFCNFKSYRAVQLRTLNTYRASLILTEFLCTGFIPSVKEVNTEEPFFTFPMLNVLSGLSNKSSSRISLIAKEAACQIMSSLQLGSKFDDVISSPDEADFLFNLYQNEQYILVEKKGRYLALLRTGASPSDLLKALFQATYLYYIKRDEQPIIDREQGSPLAISYDFVLKELPNVQRMAEAKGWHSEGLVAMPLPFRLKSDQKAS